MASPDSFRKDFTHLPILLFQRNEGMAKPYTPNSNGKNKTRAILDDALAVVEKATPDHEWLSRDLRSVVEREIEALKHDGGS